MRVMFTVSAYNFVGSLSVRLNSNVPNGFPYHLHYQAPEALRWLGKKIIEILLTP